MDVLRKWIFVLVGTAAVSAAAKASAPKSAACGVLKAVCAMAAVMALLSLSPTLDMREMKMYLTESRNEARRVTSSAAERASEETRFIIERECASYILDKAGSLGAYPEVNVTASWSENGYWYPTGAEIRGTVTEDVKTELTYYIEAALGIGAEEQIWSTDDENN